ncbi:MAG: hypothetical protein M3R23_03565, partial [Actinomycetota bacterium]|nr:hypothetical protein [Actinomycetota bacterium]
TYSDGTSLTQTVSALGPQGSRFVLTATRSLALQFGRVLTNGTTPPLSTTASGGVNNLLYTPTLAALSQNGCGGTGGTAISVSGGGTLSIGGDIVSNGAISVSSGNVKVAGDIYARCQPSVPGSVANTCYPSGATPPCTYPDVAGATRSGYRFNDPNYPPPPVTGPSRGIPANDVVLFPGVYASDPQFGIYDNSCYFLSAGVYQWTRGLTNDGPFVSNELKPPDEPLDTDNTQPARRQLWNINGVQCAGLFRVSAVGGAAIQTGTWAVEVTSTRTDTYEGVNYARESAPSLCRTVSIGAGQILKVQISNVPGATAYNVYAAPPTSNRCRGPFGLVGSIAVLGPVQSTDTSGCPTWTSPCTLGTETALFDATILGGWSPNGSAPGNPGSAPPDSETAPLGFRQVNQNPMRGVSPRGDRANENQCANLNGSPAACPGPITPGAVSLYIPSGGCLVYTNNGDNFIFSGYQYNWIVLYEPGRANPPANTCSNLLDAASNSALIGLVYTPAAAVEIPTRAAVRTEHTGGFIANTITFSGTMPLVVFSSDYAPAPPAAKLVA